MQTYLVGGAVRDMLLGLPVSEKDWLITGVSAEELSAQGFQPVGQVFQTFLHPKTHEEYSLPRGEHGISDDELTQVKNDLSRRDLTINAIAQRRDGQLIDPLNGQQDLIDRRLKHTPAFAEDPIRILRLARFKARYHEFEFTIAPETQALITTLVAEGKLDKLTPERVWAEWHKALQDPTPWIFFDTLRTLNVLAVIAPELDRLFGVPQPAQYHPEIDTGLHCLMVLEQACKLTQDPKIRFAAWLHDLGKGTTLKALWPSHIDHEGRGVALVDQLCRRLRCPDSWRRLARVGARQHLNGHRIMEMKASSLLRLLKNLDAFRNPDQLEAFLIICEADARGRTGFENRDYPQANYLRQAYQQLAELDIKNLIENMDDGKKIEEKITQARQKILTKFLKAKKKAR